MTHSKSHLAHPGKLDWKECAWQLSLRSHGGQSAGERACHGYEMALGKEMILL